MKILTRIFFCTFAIVSFYSCEPEDLEIAESELILPDYEYKMEESGDHYNEVYTKEEHRNEQSE